MAALTDLREKKNLSFPLLFHLQKLLCPVQRRCIISVHRYDSGRFQVYISCMPRGGEEQKRAGTAGGRGSAPRKRSVARWRHGRTRAHATACSKGLRSDMLLFISRRCNMLPFPVFHPILIKDRLTTALAETDLHDVVVTGIARARARCMHEGADHAIQR